MDRASRNFLRLLAFGAAFAFTFAAVLLGSHAFCQMNSGPMGQAEVQQKLAAVKASATENQQKLHQYTWIETSRISVNGNEKPARESTCSYGADGKVHKVTMGGAMGPGQSSGRGGRFRQRVVEKKTAEIKDYMQQVGRVIALYVPPNPEKMQQAFQQHKVSFDRSEGTANLVFKDYALPGDAMAIAFDTAARKIRSLDVKSYLDTPQDAVALRVEFASLPDGTNHPSRTTLNAQAKKIRVVSTNSNYTKVGQ